VQEIGTDVWTVIADLVRIQDCQQDGQVEMARQSKAAEGGFNLRCRKRPGSWRAMDSARCCSRLLIPMAAA
jgi:hypothetical protein